jgi:hypothetical protein
MIQRSATVLFLLFVMPAGLVVAQTPAASAAEFCASAPHELLTALDGSWTLTQGPGLAIGGLPIPLPAHPPVPVTLEYILEGGHAILNAQGQDMLMMPTTTEDASELLGELNQYLVTSTEGMDACDWYALPTLVGTNLYDLSFNLVTPVMDPDPVSIYFCINGTTHGYGVVDFREVTIGDQVENVPVLDRFRPEDQGGLIPCNIPIGTLPAGMTMTVALKFDSPSSARGMLTFEGASGPFPFAAWAPITMAR